jgi:transcriptional regulator with XRE-family HTH domain
MVAGELLRTLRGARGIPVETLARWAGETPQAVTAIERSEHSGDAAAGRLIHLLGTQMGRVEDASARLDDAGLIARQRAMTIGERLESGFELSSFASDLVGAARR